MSDATGRLRARRAALTAHSELQRRELQDQARRIGAAAESLDRGIGAVRRFATPPLLAAGGIAMAVLLRRGRVRKAFAAGLTVLGLAIRFRSVGQVLAGFAGKRSSLRR